MSHNKEEIRHLKAVNRQQLELIQKQEVRHKAELEKRSRLEWRALQEKLEKLKGAERIIDSKEKELGLLKEHLSTKEADYSHLHDEVRSLRNAELPPCSSMDDITQVGLSKRERDMAMRNSELSYRIRVLEGDITKLKGHKEVLEHKLVAARQELGPLKEHNDKLFAQISESNSQLRSRENKMNQLSKQLMEVKSTHQHLQEDYDKQERKLHQKNSQALKYEAQLHRLKSRNQKLADDLNQVQRQLKESEESRLQEQMYFSSSLQSPTPTISDDDHLSVSSSSAQLKEQLDQLEFDKDEMAANYSELEAKYDTLQAKYNDMKNEYKNAREKYKHLQKLYEQSQHKLKQDNSSQIKKNAARDILLLEREIQLLRSSKEENNFDEDREKLTALALETRLNEYQERVGNLESFIVHQDRSLMLQEIQWREEFSKLSHCLYNLPASHGEDFVEFTDGNEISQYPPALSSDPNTYDKDSTDYAQANSAEDSLPMVLQPYSSQDPGGVHSSAVIVPPKYQQHLSSWDNVEEPREDWVPSPQDMSTQTPPYLNLDIPEDHSYSEQFLDPQGSEKGINQSYHKDKYSTGTHFPVSPIEEPSDLTMNKKGGRSDHLVHSSVQTDQIVQENNTETSELQESVECMEEELRLSEQQVHDKDLIIEEKARSIAELNQKVEELQGQLRHWSKPSTPDVKHAVSQTGKLQFDGVKDMEAGTHKEDIQGIRTPQKIENGNTTSLHDESHHKYCSQDESMASPHDNGYHKSHSKEVQVDLEALISPHDMCYLNSHSQEVQVDMESLVLPHDNGYLDSQSQEVQVDMESLVSPHDNGYIDSHSQEVQVDMESLVSLHDNGYLDSHSQEVQVDMESLVSPHDNGYLDSHSQEVQVDMESLVSPHDNGYLDSHSQEVHVDMESLVSPHDNGYLDSHSQEVQVDIEGTAALHHDGYLSVKKFSSREVQEGQVDVEAISAPHDNDYLNVKKFCSQEIQVDESDFGAPWEKSANSEVKQSRKTENGEQEYSIEHLRMKNKELKKKIIALKEQLKQAEINESQNDRAIVEKEKRIKKLEMEVHKVQDNVIHLEKLGQSRVHELEDRELRMEGLLKEKTKKLESQIRKLQDQLAQLKQQLRYAESQHDKGQALVEEKDLIIRQFKSELYKSKKDLEYLEKELQATRKRDNAKDLLIEEKTRSIKLLELELGNVILQNNSQAASDAVKSLFDVSEAQNLVHDIKIAFKKLDDHAQSDDINMKSIMQDLKGAIEKLLQFFLHCDFLPLGSTEVLTKTTQEVTGLDGICPVQNTGPSSELLRLFVVVMDYDPLSLCITGQPERELTLQSGVMVVVLGEMDEQGYYTARHSNTEGLVPANFVQEIEVKNKDKMLSSVEDFNEVLFSHGTPSWADSESYHREASIQDSHCKEGSIAESALSNLVTIQEAAVTMTSTNSSNLGEVKRDEQPSTDEEQILYLAVCDYNPISSSSSTNPEFELHFKEGDLIKIFGEKMADGYYIGELNGRRGFVPAALIVAISMLKSTSPCLSTSKKMRALYDYFPGRDSPNPNPEMELSFHAGDAITIYGTMHDDGFYTGHIKDRIGLVPSNFIKESD